MSWLRPGDKFDICTKLIQEHERIPKKNGIYVTWIYIWLIKKHQGAFKLAVTIN